MTETSEGATRRLLTANTARIRQLADVARRLFEQTSQRLVHLQTENERAGALCRLLPQQREGGIARLGKLGASGNLSGALDQIHNTARAMDAVVKGRALPPEPVSGLTAAAEQTKIPAGSEVVRGLATRVSGLAQQVEQVSSEQRPRRAPVLPHRLPADRPVVSTATKP